MEMKLEYRKAILLYLIFRAVDKSGFVSYSTVTFKVGVSIPVVLVTDLQPSFVVSPRVLPITPYGLNSTCHCVLCRLQSRIHLPTIALVCIAIVQR